MSDPRARLGEYLIPPKARPVLCKSCQAQIVWTKTGTGADMPLSLATARIGADGLRYALTHFADCRNAAQHRRPPAPREPAADSKLVTVDLRDLPNYLERNHLVVVGSTIDDDGHGRLIITLQTKRKE